MGNLILIGFFILIGYILYIWLASFADSFIQIGFLLSGRLLTFSLVFFVLNGFLHSSWFPSLWLVSLILIGFLHSDWLSPFPWSLVYWQTIQGLIIRMYTCLLCTLLGIYKNSLVSYLHSLKMIFFRKVLLDGQQMLWKALLAILIITQLFLRTNKYTFCSHLKLRWKSFLPQLPVFFLRRKSKVVTVKDKV